MYEEVWAGRGEGAGYEKYVERNICLKYLCEYLEAFIIIFGHRHNPFLSEDRFENNSCLCLTDV